MSGVLEIVDLADAGQVQLRMKAATGTSEVRAAPPVAFQNPLDESDYREIAWYFQDYLLDPFGPAKSRAEAVETGLRNLGRLLFEVVFRGNQEAESCSTDACAEGLSSYQLAIVSRRSEFLALPWELLNEPEHGYLASQLAGVVRRSSAEPMPRFAGQLPTDQLNVLLVSPMPLAQNTSPESRGAPGTLAGETLKALESLEAQVELDCLRPPTFAALADRLAQRPGHYHIVHFDGFACHGDRGLLFEAEDYTPDPVPVSRVAELLAVAGVPVALLVAGAPHSGGAGAWSSLAASLGEGGVSFVVTVPCPLARSAGELLVQRFYHALAQGAEIPSAVAQARQALMDNPHRTTPSGKVVFWDWTLPGVHQAQEYTPPAIEVEQTNPLTLPTLPQPQEQTGPENQLPQGGSYGLVGRSAELRQLERLFCQGPVVLMAGNTGVGKTELALGIAQWSQKTGMRPGGVFYTTFEVGAGLERVVHEIGTALGGLDFADLSVPQQRRWVVDYLQQHPSLLVWDSLESAAGFPSGAPGLLDQEEQAALDAFLAEAIQGGQSWALLVSRREQEPWLSTPHQVYQLGGLDLADRIELGGKILDRAQVDPQRLGPDYLKLLEQVEGHPLALQIALPLLKDVPASVVLGELAREIPPTPLSQRGDRGDLPDEEGRDRCLTALMEYAFSRMSRRSRVHLPFLSLFQRRVMMDIVTHITQERVYRTVMGEELGWGACRTLLRSACDAGFLEVVTPSVFQIHPAFPWFYGRKLHRQVPASGIRLLEQEFVRVYADTADYFMEQLYENQDSGATAVLAEEGNLTQALGLALEARQWDNAQLLVQPIAQVYRMQKRYAELRRLRRQLLEAAGTTAAEAQANGAIDLWLYLMGTEASESVDLGQLEYAEGLNRQLLEYLATVPEGATDPRTAAVYHQFGAIAQRRWQLEEAEDWFHRSLAIIEKDEDRAAVADDYYCLGQVRHYQRRYTEAMEWFRKALDIHQRLGDPEELVKDYRSLGLAAQYKFEYKEAESWYHRARDIVEENRDEDTATLVYHELGTLFHAQYLFDEAENWYQQALTLSDRLGKEDQMAVEFHHLGLLNQTRAGLDPADGGVFYQDAEEWYLLALEKQEKLGNRRATGDQCRQLGVLFHEQKRLDEAQKWYDQARRVFEEVQDLPRTARTYGQLGMVAEERGDLTEALEWVARTYLLALEHNLPVLVQVKAHLARLREKHGAESFAQWWRGFTGGDPPADLDEVDPSAIL